MLFLLGEVEEGDKDDSGILVMRLRVELAHFEGGKVSGIEV